jgi:UDP-N-acetylmuramoyl-L-alanyl-D-glutamate--2,6-diaminopimelate ligase
MSVVPDMPFARHLSELMAGMASVPAGDDRLITGLSSDSRAVVAGDLFFARQGLHVDASVHVADAVAAGAVAVVMEASANAPPLPRHVPIIHAPGLPQCMGRVAHRFFGEPSRTLQVIGVTGTNGKTSVSHHLGQALNGWQSPAQEKGLGCGLIGTLGYGLFGDLKPARHTTPDAITTHHLLADMNARRARFAVMEVSSHALDQERTAGVAFDVAVFTNLTRDHLDYHRDMAAYGAAKRRLFESPGLNFAVLNLDDPFAAYLLEQLPAGVQAVPYGTHPSDPQVEVYGALMSADRQGIHLMVESPWGKAEVRTPIFGGFNAANLLAVLSTLIISGMPFETAVASMGELKAPPGRMECFGGVDCQPLIVVDYAHSPSALSSVLETLRAQCAGALWCVFGCGGERDKGKRSLMGAAAAHGADVVLLTDDNPRDEDGQTIIDDILSGIPPRGAVIVERDREAAIGYAIETAGPNDVILVAGKGHEQFQEIQRMRRPFSDARAVRKGLRERSP